MNKSIKILYLILTLSLLIPHACAQELITQDKLTCINTISKDTLIASFSDGTVFTVTPHTISESRYVTVSVQDSAKLQKAKTESNCKSFQQNSIKSIDSRENTFTVWVDVPWNGANATGKYNISVTYNNKEYVIDPWWNVAWKKVLKITFDTFTTGVTENLIHFPVMIKLDSTRIDWEDVEVDGDDLRFVAKDNTTLFPYEIEYWDYNVSAVIWVAVDEIEHSSTTDYMWLYYSKPGSAAGENAEEVWDKNYIFVHHMYDDPDSSTVTDSSSTGDTGAKLEANGPLQVLDELGYAQKFDDVDDYISFGNESYLRPYTGITLSCMVRNASAATTTEIINYRKEGSPYYIYTIQIDKAAVSLNNAGSAVIETSTYDTPITASPHGVALTYSKSAQKVLSYINGTLQADQEATAALDIYADMSDVVALYAGAAKAGLRPINGILDEIRLSNISRSSSWLSAEYNTAIDNFVSYSVPFLGIAMIVYDTNGELVSGANIIGVNERGDFRIGSTNANGQCFSDVVEGTYTVYVSKDNYEQESFIVTVDSGYTFNTVILHQLPTSAVPLLIPIIILVILALSVFKKR